MANQRFLGRRRVAGQRLTRPQTMMAAPHDIDDSSPVTTSDAIESPEYGQSGGGAVVLFTAEQAAALLQVRPSWLRRKAAARIIPCRYLGKHLRFARHDISAIADQYASGTAVNQKPAVPRHDDL
jgi:Helix-turn-helix domain